MMRRPANITPALGLVLAASVLALATASDPARAGGAPPGAAKGGGRMSVPGNAVAAGSNRFALDLYGRLRGGGGNLFFSPYSIATALAMTSAGAKGETDREIADVLHIPADPGARHAGFRALVDRLNGKGAGTSARPDTLVTANALWLQKGEPFLPAFLDTTRSDYGASAFEVDFAGASEEARKAINAWVEGQTAQKIRELVGPIDLISQTVLVLTNAIYYKGAWSRPFSEKATRRDGVFTAPGGRKVNVPLMVQSESFGYLDGGSFQAVELPYEGNERSMVVLLPKDTEGLDALEASLTAEKLDGWLAKLGRAKVNLEIPKFRLEEGFELGPVLQALGMTRSFDPGKADFSGMTGRRDLSVSKVIHKAFVDVNEAGTEAAAATAVVMVRGMAMLPEKPILFRADHPFLFLIRDASTGAILFLGRVVDPKG